MDDEENGTVKFLYKETKPDPVFASRALRIYIPAQICEAAGITHRTRVMVCVMKGRLVIVPGSKGIIAKFLESFEDLQREFEKADKMAELIK